MEQDLTESQPGLKRLVIFLGLLVAVGLIVVVTTIAMRIGEMDETAAGGDQAVSGRTAPFIEPVSWPGESLVSMEPDGGRLYLHLRMNGISDRIVVLNAADGTVLWEIGAGEGR